MIIQIYMAKYPLWEFYTTGGFVEMLGMTEDDLN